MDPDLEIHSSDDEETLAMKENLLKIRLKKKLLAKSKGASSQRPGGPPRPSTPPPKPLHSLQNPFASPKSASASTSGSRIQVPGSPSPQKRRPLPVSPARIILGIDKGRTGRDISLKRTPEKPVKTFNQRLAETKSLQYVQEAKARQLATSRTSSFNPVPAFTSDTALSEKEGVTGLKISDRKVSADDCQKAASSVTKVLSIHQFYAEVSPPDFEMSESVAEYIVYGIVASKSTTRTTAGGAKYCVLQMTDLKTDITMFLYDSAFEKFWTLSLGTLCYFLNPQFQKPRAGANASKLSLKMTDDMGVLEIGKSTDFGICRSMKKDGTQCTTWIDSKKQEVCDYHIDLTLQKTLNKRIEFASGTKLFDPREPSKKKKKESEDYAQHALFFGDQITTMKGPSGTSQDYDAPVRDIARLQRESEARQREREVLARLMKNSAASAGHEYFETTDPNAPEDTETEGSEQERVFSASVLRKLGFDPTKRVNQSLQSHAGPSSGAGEEGGMSDRDLGLHKDVDSVDLTVSLGKGSALFTARANPNGEEAAGTSQTVAEDSDSELEIIR